MLVTLVICASVGCTSIAYIGYYTRFTVDKSFLTVYDSALSDTPSRTTSRSNLTPWTVLTFNAPIATKVVCFNFLSAELYGKQCGPRSGAVCFGSTQYPSIPNWSVMLGNYLQQTTSADDIFGCIFSMRFKG